MYIISEEMQRCLRGTVLLYQVFSTSHLDIVSPYDLSLRAIAEAVTNWYVLAWLGGESEKARPYWAEAERLTAELGYTMSDLFDCDFRRFSY